MATANATVTGKTGPGYQVTALVLPNVTLMDLEPVAQIIRFKYGSNQRFDLDLGTVTTFTVTIAAGVYTVVVS